MPTLVSYINHAVTTYADKTALIFGDTRINYDRFGDAVKRLARALHNLGVEKGESVVVLLPNVPHFVISYYAILEIGAKVVPLNFLSSQDLDYFFKDSEAKAIIAWSGFSDAVMYAVEKLDKPVELIFLGEQIPPNTKSLTRLMEENEPIEYFEAAKEDELAAILYTAGISGQPLGAEMAHSALLSNAVMCRDMLHISDKDVSLAVLPLFHPLAQTFSMNMALLSGATLVLMPRYDLAQVDESIQAHSPTYMAAVPSVYEALLNSQADENNCFKFCLCYGGLLLQETREQYESRFNTRILPAYGLTEAGPLVAMQRYSDESNPGSVGLPILGVELQIRDEKGNQLHPNRTGEIWVKSPCIMRGYHNRPRETELYLQDEWLFTGDIGYLDMEYHLYVKERQEEIITRGGFAIYPSEIEECINRHVGIEDVAVVGVINSTMGSELKAYVVLKPGQTVSEAEVLASCESLPAYMVPRHVEFVSSIPKTKTGRKLKRLLRSIAESTPNQNKRNR